MKFKIVFILFLAFIKTFCQEKVTIDDLYFEDGIAYNKSDNKKFTGILQDKKKRNHIKWEEIYDNGSRTKILVYFNIYNRQVVCDEFIFNVKTSQKTKHIGYSSDGSRYWETEFDENQKKKNFSFYKSNVLYTYQEFKNNKKHGKWFCIDKQGNKYEIEYNNGKKIKSQTIL
ncbi:hypothetical protein [Chryseobacterium sp. MMS23-Vi53]|uniref:hypothetical protein n=1 Tax=Chryseobacterium sp. MMS23-Vi53 TaxID=3386644 RepID=UPI0039EA1D7F